MCARTLNKSFPSLGFFLFFFITIISKATVSKNRGAGDVGERWQTTITFLNDYARVRVITRYVREGKCWSERKIGKEVVVVAVVVVVTAVSWSCHFVLFRFFGNKYRCRRKTQTVVHRITIHAEHVCMHDLHKAHCETRSTRRDTRSMGKTSLAGLQAADYIAEDTNYSIWFHCISSDGGDDDDCCGSVAIPNVISPVYLPTNVCLHRSRDP